MKIVRVIGVLVLVVLGFWSLTGCDDRPCEAGHYDFIPVRNGKTTTLHPYWVCDKYAEEK